MIEKNQRRPFLGIWFGNFYEPAYSNRAFIDEMMHTLSRLGFTSVELDSKAWEDFALCFAGEKPSPYVAMQEYMMEAAQREGLSYYFLGLYLNADNLYPIIRFSPPIYGESTTNRDGSDGKWYKYWSPLAQDSMVAHVNGLLSRYEKQARIVLSAGEEVLPVCTMWDPVVAPSFDAEGISRYLGWLRQHYQDDIARLNQCYATDYAGFDAMRPEEYWFSQRFPDMPCYTLEDLRGMTPAFWLWNDNMCWRRDELIAYFAEMQRRFRAIRPEMFLMPDMAQWGYYLNVDASKITGIGFSDLWDTAMRGLDIFMLSPYVDSCYFISVPVTMDAGPDAYVTACHHAMIRAMNLGREFLGGIYWGRFLYSDVYRWLSPTEIIGEIVASGAKGYTSYGCCGLDDGGVLHRMDEGFLNGLRVGNEWASAVIPRICGEKHKDVALVFPAAASLLRPLSVEGSERQRMDLLGWYRALCDMGYAPDIVHEDYADAQALSAYQAVILPGNDCYAAMPNARFEKALGAYVDHGGMVLHGPYDALASRCFGIQMEPADDTCFDYHGGGLLLGGGLCAVSGERLAAYRYSGKTCVGSTAFGIGRVISIGFDYGYQMSAKTAPHVPLSEKNRELYPLALMPRDPVADSLLESAPPASPMPCKYLTCTRYKNGMVFVNHSVQPVRLCMKGRVVFQYPVDGATLLPHSAAWIQEEDGNEQDP